MFASITLPFCALIARKTKTLTSTTTSAAESTRRRMYAAMSPSRPIAGVRCRLPGRRSAGALRELPAPLRRAAEAGRPGVHRVDHVEDVGAPRLRLVAMVGEDAVALIEVLVH